MKRADVVVIGGSAAGLTAAITARRHYPDKDVLIIRKEDRVLIPCGIPYIFGTVGDIENDLIPDAVLDKHGIGLVVDEVTEIDTDSESVSTDGGQRIGYDRLVIATGSLPMMPPVPGFDKENVFAVYKDVELLGEVQEAVNDAGDLVIVGGGFIGVEFADECNKLGDINVTIVEMLPYCLNLSYDDAFCQQAESILNDRGVRTVTESKVEEVLDGDSVEAVRLDDGEELEADAVILGIGATANVELAKNAGIRVGTTGGIVVDRTMRKLEEGVFACGDCAEKESFFGGRPCPLKLASIATAEARIAGANLYDTRRENIGTVGVWSTCIGDTALATAGLTETMATDRGYDVVTGEAEAPNRHPGGMPGMQELRCKLVFEERSAVLLGGQVIGDKAAGELINAISACVQNRMTAEDIATFQTGTHPALTASPIAYQFVNAAEEAISKMSH